MTDLNASTFLYFNAIIILMTCADKRYPSCADPEIFMRGGPTKMVIFGHSRGGSNPPKIPKLPFF